MQAPTTRCQFHEHFMLGTYSRGKNKLMRFEKCAQDDSTAYFATSESYEPKFIMKSIAGVNDEKKKLFFLRRESSGKISQSGQVFSDYS
jgi:hypothetical protein